MRSTFRRKKRWLSAAFLVFLALGWVSVDLSAGGCEKGFFMCVSDPYWQATPFGVVFCGSGYLFCKKYIER